VNAEAEERQVEASAAALQARLRIGDEAKENEVALTILQHVYGWSQAWLDAVDFKQGLKLETVCNA
jgi:hypothetical protein